MFHLNNVSGKEWEPLIVGEDKLWKKINKCCSYPGMEIIIGVFLAKGVNNNPNTKKAVYEMVWYLFLAT